MNHTVFSENLKQFRIAKNLTQEQAAAAFCVNTQTVSRWECGTTLPDVLMLPKIAELYGVTTDDFYKRQSVAYDNYAQRLSAVYEKSRDPEDFMRCMLEYRKQMKHSELSTADKWNYATIHHFMGRYCKEVALDWYDRAIADGPAQDSHAYRRARSMRIKLMWEIGRIKEVIAAQAAECETKPNDVLAWLYLLEAYLVDDNYEAAFDVFRNAVERFPDNWLLYIHGGTIYAARQQYDAAFQCWDKAGELGTYFYDDLYCKASCYDDMGEYGKASDLYLEIAEQLRADHYDVEADMAEAEADRIRQKLR